MRKLITGVKLLIVMTIITGILYPLTVTLAAQLLFREKANGSLIKSGEKILGSELIGQNFSGPEWFESRPSASEYNGLLSGGSNFSISNVKQQSLIGQRREEFMEDYSLNLIDGIPPEMLTASASGLDPHISKKAAILQVEKITVARGFEISRTTELYRIIENITEPPQFHILGEERINVFMLNLALDSIK